MALPSKMNFLSFGIVLALTTITQAQTCTNGVESANPLGTCGGCEDQVQAGLAKSCQFNFINFLFSFS